MGIADILNAIDKHDYISFDIFDTLLVRPYVNPIDLFWHIEYNEHLSGFTKARILAEKNTRTKSCPEVTIDEIYANIDLKFRNKKDIELKYESQVLQQNPEMKKIFDHAVLKKKKIILISDMYLPSSFVSKILDKNGYSEYERLYMSCEYRKSKHFGDLFSQVLDDLNISPNELLHIGDNKVSDYKTPANMGITTSKYEKVIDRYFASHKREHNYYKRKKNFERSVIVAIDALHWINIPDENDFWYEFGYKYGGPMNSAFATFIENNTTNDGVLLFIARDGYNAQKAYKIIYGNIENHYVYAMRTFNILFGINGRDYPGYEEDIIKYFSNVSEVKELSGTPEEKYFGNKDMFEKLMDIELEKYGTYIKNCIGEKDIVYVIDSTTEKFSSQKLIDAASKKNTQGIYFTLLHSRSNDKAKGFNDNHRVFLELTSIDMPEFLMTSNEYPVDDIDIIGNPIYSKKDNPEEWYRKEISSEITKGVEDYARTFMSVFGEYVPSFEYNSIGSWIRSFARHMDPCEYLNLKNVKWASDPAHSEYHGLIFSASDAPMLFRYKIRDYYRSMMRRIKNI